jgi:hypothetical protein
MRFGRLGDAPNSRFLGRLSPLAWTYSPVPTAHVQVSTDSIVVRPIWRRSTGVLVVPIAERDRIRLTNDLRRLGALLEIDTDAYTPLRQIEVWGSTRFGRVLRAYGWIEDSSDGRSAARA